MALTQKQESFCLAYIETGNASEAYRRSYSAGGMKPETVNRKAKALLDDGKIAARLQDLRRPAVEAAQMTLESHLARLAFLSKKAERARQYSAAITAETNRGRAAGFYTEKVDHTTGGKPMPTPAAPAVINVTIGGK
ncbi:terminase small subunit [Castellaniella ginsengisoli]